MLSNMLFIHSYVQYYARTFPYTECSLFVHHPQQPHISQHCFRVCVCVWRLRGNTTTTSGMPFNSCRAGAAREYYEHIAYSYIHTKRTRSHSFQRISNASVMRRKTRNGAPRRRGNSFTSKGLAQHDLLPRIAQHI